MKRLYGYLKKAMATKDKKKLTAVVEALSINNLLKDKMSRSLFQAEPAMRGILSSTSFEENDDGEVETEAQSRAVAEKAKMLEDFIKKFAGNVPDPIVIMLWVKTTCKFKCFFIIRPRARVFLQATGI